MTRLPICTLPEIPACAAITVSLPMTTLCPTWTRLSSFVPREIRVTPSAALSMVVFAALVGANGLGKPVVRALNTVNIAQGFEAGLAIVVVAILMDRIMRRTDPPGSRGGH